MGFLTRTPTGNEPPASSRSKWLEGDPEIADEVFMLLSGNAERCAGCKKVTSKKHIDVSGLCPDCRIARTARRTI